MESVEGYIFLPKTQIFIKYQYFLIKIFSIVHTNSVSWNINKVTGGEEFGRSHSVFSYLFWSSICSASKSAGQKTQWIQYSTLNGWVRLKKKAISNLKHKMEVPSAVVFLGNNSGLIVYRNLRRALTFLCYKYNKDDIKKWSCIHPFHLKISLMCMKISNKNFV